MQKLVLGGTYRHYKNKLYKVIDIVRHSETQEELVLYETLYDNPSGRLWVRPMIMFLEEIKTGDYSGPRFKFEMGSG